MKRPRIKSKEVVASSRAVRAGWIRVYTGAFPRVKMLFSYNGNGVNMLRI